jgi:hypothetical protein
MTEKGTYGVRDMMDLLGIQRSGLYKAIRAKRIEPGALIRTGRRGKVLRRVWRCDQAARVAVQVAALPDEVRDALARGPEVAQHRRREARDLGWWIRRACWHLGPETVAELMRPIHRGALKDLPRDRQTLARAALRSALARAGQFEEPTN